MGFTMRALCVVVLLLAPLAGCTGRRFPHLSDKALADCERQVKPLAVALRDSLVLKEDKASQSARVVFDVPEFQTQVSELHFSGAELTALSGGRKYDIFFSGLGRCVKLTLPPAGAGQQAIIDASRTRQCPNPLPNTGECIRFEVYIVDDHGITWSIFLDPNYNDLPVPHCGGYEPSLAKLRKWTRERNCINLEATSPRK